MDITDAFLKAAKFAPPKSAQARKGLKTSEFVQQAADLLRSLRKIDDIRATKRFQYLDPLHFMPSKASSFTDAEREDFEESILDSYKVCEQQLEELKASLNANSKHNQQLVKFHHEIVQYLADRTKLGLQSAKEDQRKRVRRPFFLSKRLLPEGVELSPKLATSPPAISITTSTSTPTSELTPANVSTRRAAVETSRPAVEFTEEETRQFKVENLQLHHHLNDEIDAARKVEKQVYDIGNMMSQFAQEIGGQNEVLKSIAKDAESAKDNVDHGNQSLKSATDYGEGIGFTIFCIYFGASCLLLFFHYY